MAKKKRPENETMDEATQRQILEQVANFATRSEKTSWNRKMDNMVKLLAELHPIEEKILKIILEEKQPLMDAVNELRGTMVKECIHPYDQLVLHDDYIECKFCGRKLNIPNDEQA